MSDLAPLLAPFGEDAPAGKDVSYDAEYGKIGYLRDPPEGEAADFDEIEEVARRILEEQSKDLTVAIWLLEAWVGRDGFAGLRRGLELVHGLLQAFWDSLFPTEHEDRVYALDFVREKLVGPTRLIPITDWGHIVFHYEQWKGVATDAFGGEPAARAKGKKKGEETGSSSEPSGENFETGFRATSKATYKELSADIAASREALAELESFGLERLTELPKGVYPPRYKELAAVVAKAEAVVGELLAQKLLDDPDPVEPVPASAGTGGRPGTGDTGTSGGAVSQQPGAAAVSAEPTSAADAAQRIMAGARFLRNADPTAPAPYLLVRAFRWGELRRSAGALDARLLDSPDIETRKRLKSLLLEGEWETLLAEAEDLAATPVGRAWLDLQRYVLTALENLGPEYRPVLNAIVGQLGSLLAELPELPRRTLLDDTPAANSETVDWLERMGLTGDGEDRAGPARSTTYDQELVMSEATYEKAREWVASGNPSQGVSLLLRRADHEKSERGRFITQSLAAEIMVEAGMGEAARPILSDLVKEVDTRKLEDWEARDVIARPVALLYRCLPANDRQRAALYDQICRLDPLQAVMLKRDSSHGVAQPPAQAAHKSEPADQAAADSAVDSGSSDQPDG